MRDALRFQEIPELACRERAQIARDDDRGAAEQRQQQLADRDVEADRDRGENPVAGGDRIVFEACEGEVDGRGMRDGDAFGRAARA